MSLPKFYFSVQVVGNGHFAGYAKEDGRVRSVHVANDYWTARELAIMDTWRMRGFPT